MKNAVIKPQRTISNASLGIIFSLAIFVLCILIKDIINPYLVMVVMVLSLVVAQVILINKTISSVKIGHRTFSGKTLFFLIITVLCAITLFLVLQNIVRIVPAFNS